LSLGLFFGDMEAAIMWVIVPVRFAEHKELI